MIESSPTHTAYMVRCDAPHCGAVAAMGASEAQAEANAAREGFRCSQGKWYCPRHDIQAEEGRYTPAATGNGSLFDDF